MMSKTVLGTCLMGWAILTLCFYTGCGPKEGSPTPAHRSTPQTPATPPPAAEAVPSVTKSVAPATSSEAAPVAPKPAPKKETPKPVAPIEEEKATIIIPPAVVGEIDKELKGFAGVCVSINELAMDMDIVRDEVAPNLAALKKICKANELRVVLNYQPCFETTQAKFIVRKKSPWSWAFAVQKGPNDICDCVLLNLSGESPVFSVTKDGQWRFPETAMIPLGTLVWSVEDANGARVGKEVSGQFIKPGRVTASVAFPSGDCPQFLDKMFDINLIASTGQLKFLTGHELYFQPVGKSAVRVPLFEYYQKKREEKEKKRGSAFDAKVHPSPIKDAIGMIVYMEVVHNLIENSGITERNDTGFDLFIENAQKQKLLLYTARPK